MPQIPASGEPYSYRQDPAVPTITHPGPIAVMDGDCALCTFGARMIAALDRREEIAITTTGSDTGAALLRHYGLDPEDPDTWLAIIDGVPHTSLSAMIRLAAKMGGWGHALAPLRLIPRSLQDWLYRRIARNRYRLFGQADMCAAPDERLRRRLLR